MKSFPKKTFLIVLILGLFLPVFDAQAQSWLFGLDTIAYSAASGIFAYSLSIIFTILGKVLSVLVSMLDWVVRIRIYTDLPVIQSSWKIMRDFANMLFIIALIVMAYGTIFNIQGYDFRSLIGRFVVIAVLINFSLVLGGLMIDATQVLNNTFLNAMGDISDRLGQGLSPTALLPKGVDIYNAESIVDVFSASIVTLFFGIFFLFAFIVSVAVPLAVAFVRIPILWALLIISPLAWLLSILPATKGAYDKWWHQFLAWNLFLPYYLFFLYFALFFLSQQDVVIAGMLRGSAGQAVVNQTFNKFGIQNSVTFGLLFYYILVAIFLIGGTKVAMSAGTFSGTGIVSVGKWGRGVAMRRFGVTAAQKGAMQRLEQVQKEGLPGRFGVLYGGERGLERDTAKWAEGFGVTGAKDVQMIKEIGELKSKFARVTDPEQLRALKDKGRTPERLAIREIMKGRNLLTSDELLETYELYGGNRSLAGKQFARSVNYDKLSGDERKKWLGVTANDIETQQKIFGVMADKKDPYMRDKENVEKALDFFKLEGEQRDLLKKVEKYNLKMATELQITNKLLRGRDGQLVTNLRDGLKEIVERLKPDDLLEYTSTLTKDPELIELTKGTLNKQKVEAILAKGTQNQLEAWGPLMEDTIQKMEEEKNNALQKQAKVTEGAVERGVRRGMGGGGISGTGQGGQPPPQQQPPTSGTTPPTTPGPRRPAGFIRPGEKVQNGNVVDLRNRENQ